MAAEGSEEMSGNGELEEASGTFTYGLYGPQLVILFAVLRSVLLVL